MNDNNGWTYWDNEEKHWVVLNHQQACEKWGENYVVLIDQRNAMLADDIERHFQDGDIKKFFKPAEDGCFYL
jgi:hypothetical protein